jgi:hypothetical protein
MKGSIKGAGKEQCSACGKAEGTVCVIIVQCVEASNWKMRATWEGWGVKIFSRRT